MSDFELPMYAIVGERPVKGVSTPEGGMDVLAFNWDTGEFERDMSYLTELVFETEHITEEEFEEYVQQLRASGG
jgi:hypothetical protein